MKQLRIRQKMILKDFQERLVDNVVERLNKENIKKYIFQAPTGTGKTFITANIVEQMIEKYSENLTFIYIAPSTNSLHKQGYNKITSYLHKNKSNLKNYNTELCSSSLPSSFFNINTVYFFGWSSINKKDNIFTKASYETEKITFWEILDSTKQKNVKIILIVDEEHLASSKTKAQDIIKRINPWKIIKMSATLDKLSDCDYKIKYKEAVNEQIVKKEVIASPSSSYKEYNINTPKIIIYEQWKKLLNDAVNKQIAVRMAYHKRKRFKINPLVIIQIPDEKIEKENYLTAEFIAKVLSDELNIAKQTIAIWLSDKKKTFDGSKITKNDIEKDDSLIDYMIFKQAAATGWDIPRANMYVKFRNIVKPNFQIQTLGRILRNPFMRYFDNKLIDCAYVFTNDKTMIRKIIENDYTSPSNKKSYYLKQEFKNNWKNKNINLYTYDAKKIFNKNYKNIYKDWQTIIANDNDYKQNLNVVINNAKGYKPKYEFIDSDTRMIEEMEDKIKSINLKTQSRIKGAKNDERQKTLLEIYLNFQNAIENKIIEYIIKQECSSNNINLREMYLFTYDNQALVKKAFFNPLKENMQKKLNEPILHNIAEYINLTDEWVNQKNNQLIHAYNVSLNEIQWVNKDNLTTSKEQQPEYKFFDSKPEARFYFEIIDNSLQLQEIKFIIRNESEKPFYVWYFNNKNQLKRYYPDFLLLLKNKLLFIEIKDDQHRDDEEYNKINAINKPNWRISNYKCEAYLCTEISVKERNLSNFLFQKEKNGNKCFIKDIIK